MHEQRLLVHEQRLLKHEQRLLSPTLGAPASRRPAYFRFSRELPQ
jgi:hypothetical protein